MKDLLLYIARSLVEHPEQVSVTEVEEGDELTLTFDEIGAIAGVPLDHSFLNYKKELLPHGWEVGKISMKQQTVRFRRLAE